MAATISPAQPPPAPINPIEHLPLALVGSHAVPPAPTRSSCTIDWLPDFSGRAWVAYGASSLLVISHLPSPLSRDESLIGPVLRQIFELSGSASAPVTAVSWSPAAPSVGELAAASENCVSLFVHDSASSIGSVRWSRDSVLVHSGSVEAVKWSGSGDGIVTGGLDVCLWRRKTDKTWEVAWKFRRDEPQNLVSATCSIEGPSASAALRVSEKSNVSNNVMVYYGSGNHEYGKTELRHPQPVSMIQWRPTPWPRSRNHLSDLPRDVLLTCCLDGTVRLWCEVDNGKVRKLGKESSDQKGMKKNFCVGAVIEINHVLNGSLGVDVFMSWAADISGVYRIGEGTTQFFSAEAHGRNTVGQCEWLVGVGPGTYISFWAVHCLDDVSPVRFPRVSLWKRQELDSFRGRVSVSDFKGTVLLNKVTASRSSLSGPSEIFSLIHLLPCNSLVWSLVYEKSPSNVEDASGNESNNEVPSLPHIGALPLEGHRGKIRQVVMYPCAYQAEFAASLDSEGLVLLWSVSAALKENLGLETLVPAWNVCGKIVNHDSCSKYTSMRWAPYLFDEDLVILLGHIRGVDCFIIHASRVGDGDLPYSYICTLPLGCNDSFDKGPANIFVVNLHSNLFHTSKFSRFLVLGIWTREFRALSWEVTFLSNNLSEHDSECECDQKTSSLCFAWKFENIGENPKNCIGVNAASSKMPELYSHDQVTCYSVVCPSTLTQTQEGSANPEHAVPGYIMATGYSDGTVKLWRSNSSKVSSPCIPWELVGKALVSEETISALYLTNCGQKIATISHGSQADGISTIQIWGTVHLAGAGNFLLEDTLSIDGNVVAFNWFQLGNGRFIVGICMKNELRVYAQKCHVGQLLLDHGKSLSLPTWSCIAVAPTCHEIRDFLWGTGTTAILIHDFHFSIHSQWLCHFDKMKHRRGCPALNTGIYQEEKDIHFPAPVFMGTGNEVDDLQEHAGGDNISGENCESLERKGEKHGFISNSLHVARANISHCSITLDVFWRIADIAWKLAEMLPVFHPEVLLVNISAGNWKRANVAVRHLTEFLSSSVGSGKGHNSATRVHSVPQIHLGNYMEGLILKNSIDRGFQWSTDAKLPASSPFMPFNQNYDAAVPGFGLSSTESRLDNSLESLENSYDLAACAVEKLQMLAVIDLLNEVQHSSSAYKNLDEPGRRFWVALRFQQLLYTRRFGRSPSTEDLVVNPQLYCWAFHSDCQDALLSSFLPKEPSWAEIRALGVGFWFTNAAQLRARMERLARSQYLRKKDPKDCALLYTALNRIHVLAGLFKISKDEKDKPLVGFLSRNFQEEKNKAAALKNAYVLMGRHQLELAIAFFLLGGDTHSAISVCSKNLKDDQLALVICRLVESHGGPMECQLIAKSILPSSNERGDYWLGSLLEWELGNYSRSFALMLGLEVGEVGKTFISIQRVAFSDPNIGLYCLLLSTKNNIKHAIGEQNAARLGRWAAFLTTTSFSRCGFPLEALEFFSSSPIMVGAKDQGTEVDNDHLGGLHLLLNPSSNDRSNWISGDTALYLEVQTKLDLTLQYFSKLTKEHPGWPDITVGSLQSVTCSKKFQDYEKLKSTFYDKLFIGLSKVEQKLSVDSSSIITMILAWLCSNGLLVVGYDVLFDYISRNNLQNKRNATAGTYHLHKPLMKAVGDISHSVSRFIISSSIASFPQTSCLIEVRPFERDAVYSQSILLALYTQRVAVKIFCDLQEDAIRNPLVVVDLVEYVAYSALFWLQRDSEGLLFMLDPLLPKSVDDNSWYEVDMAKLKESLHSVEERLTCGLSVGVSRGQGAATSTLRTPEVDNAISFSEDERWPVIGVCFWQHMFSLVDHKLNELFFEQEDSSSVGVFQAVVPFWRYSLTNLVLRHDNNSTEINSIALILAKLLKTALTCLSSYHLEFLVGFLHRKSVDKLHVATLEWLKGSSLSQTKASSPDVDHVMSATEFSTFDALWDRAADSNMISNAFEQGKIEWSHVIDCLLFRAWADFHQEVSMEQYPTETINHEVHASDGSAQEVVSSSSRGLFKSGRSILSSWQKDVTTVKGVSDFQNAKEIYKRDGELFEVMCINSINECQAAVSSNHKGIVFFNWEAEASSGHPSSYIWSDADWPPNGWAGSESTPEPTCVSPGVGLGSKRGTHLGLGGATIGMGSSSKPRRDLTAGRVFGLPGYAGVGASGLGWEVQEDFEELVDTPATLANIRTRAFSSHPCLPFFLVGSSNTHIYLWEFGKDKATATYGILPAANVPPPYALASVSAVKFDQCGHRFATAALDGTVCTWQLEVGGRSNIRPTESSLCFNGHASDVTYVTSSGSIVAAAGYNTNGVNVVIWDTLAPPTTSRASILCHEGGARSIAVFDNVIGSGSVSPLIITGGKGGDVGIHDFRYIATGRTKRHRHHDHGDANGNPSSTTATTMVNNKVGDQSSSGMLWYIPKAHLGSITKISAIPHTSLFLSGSKDGDVKLWDAKAAKLVHHWPKLHERRTFLQQSSRGFGGVTRAAVTDIQVVSNGFLSCGGDGTVKLVQLRGYSQDT